MKKITISEWSDWQSENSARHIEFTNKDIVTCFLLMQNVLPTHWIFKSSYHKIKSVLYLFENAVHFRGGEKVNVSFFIMTQHLESPFKK